MITSCKDAEDVMRGNAEFFPMTLYNRAGETLL